MEDDDHRRGILDKIGMDTMMLLLLLLLERLELPCCLLVLDAPDAPADEDADRISMDSEMEEVLDVLH